MGKSKYLNGLKYVRKEISIHETDSLPMHNRKPNIEWEHDKHVKFHEQHGKLRR